MKLIKVTAIIASIFLVACDSNTSNSFDKEKFEAYLKFKRIPLNDTSRYERLKEEYLRRAILTSAIDKTKKLDNTQIDVEVEEFRKQLVISRYFDEYLADAVSDQGVQNFYSQNIDNYKTRKVRVSHILFRVNPKMGEAERQALLTAANEAYSKANTSEKFEDIAKLVSEDKVSAAKGGDLGWINEGAIAKEFSKKAFSLEVGQISKPFSTAYGFHVIKVTEAPQVITKPLEAVKGDIRYQLRSQSKKAEAARLLESSK